MFKTSTRQILGIAILAATSLSQAEGTVQLAISGHHGKTDYVKASGDWWGIFPDGEGFTLQPTRVHVKLVTEPTANGGKEVVETQIIVPQKVEFAVLLRGLMSAAAGPLKSVKLAEYPAPLEAGKTFDLRWDSDTPENRLRLLATGRPVVKQVGEHTLRRVDDYELWLQRGSGEGATSQLLLKQSEEFGDESARLRWAGDLDRDGQVDLIYNLGGHYTRTRLALFLSSAAKPGELVGLVARWNASCGC